MSLSAALLEVLILVGTNTESFPPLFTTPPTNTLLLYFWFVLQDVIPEDKQPELLGTISKGNITMRVLRDIFDSFVNMGPLSQVSWAL
jgi:hypothetical protein